jgi:hypothetical protein
LHHHVAWTRVAAHICKDISEREAVERLLSNPALSVPEPASKPQAVS